uniref:Uncharacterized protein n=1 Tax=Arundo donax TaxID=35708 RepID=A0A0A9D8Z5_ARUDO
MLSVTEAQPPGDMEVLQKSLLRGTKHPSLLHLLEPLIHHLLVLHGFIPTTCRSWGIRPQLIPVTNWSDPPTQRG